MKSLTFIPSLVWYFAAALSFSGPNLHAQEQFYNYYDKGLKYAEKGDWLRAVSEFKSAISLEFEDKAKKRTYGTHFIPYFPHRELGIAYYNLGDADLARRELQLSLDYKSTKEAQAVLDKITQGVVPAVASDVNLKDQEEATTLLAKLKEEEQRMKEEGERLEKERQKKLKEEKEQFAKVQKEKEKQIQEELAKIEEMKRKLEADQKKLQKEKDKIATGVAGAGKDLVPMGALTYDPLKVTQVGTRLAVAVLPFVDKGNREHLRSAATDKMINQLVNMRRFRVIERAALETIIKEQDFVISDVADQDAAVKLGKLAGADAIVIGNINSVENYGSVSVRVVDTETGETIAAKDIESDLTYVWNLEHSVAKLAIQIYNEMPLVEGYMVQVEPDEVYFDLGQGEGLRKGTKCVIYREGETILSPKTKEVLGKKVTKLAEAVVVQVQERLSIARLIAEEKAGKIEVGDKVVVK